MCVKFGIYTDCINTYSTHDGFIRSVGYRSNADLWATFKFSSDVAVEILLLWVSVGTPT